MCIVLMAYFLVSSNAYKLSLYQVPLLRTIRWNLHSSVWFLWLASCKEGILHFPLPSRHGFPCCWFWVCRHTTSSHCISCHGQLIHLLTRNWASKAPLSCTYRTPEFNDSLAIFPSVLARHDPLPRRLFRYCRHSPVSLGQIWPVRLSEFRRNLDGLEECWRNLWEKTLFRMKK